MTSSSKMSAVGLFLIRRAWSMTFTIEILLIEVVSELWATACFPMMMERPSSFTSAISVGTRSTVKIYLQIKSSPISPRPTRRLTMAEWRRISPHNQPECWWCSLHTASKASRQHGLKVMLRAAETEWLLKRHPQLRLIGWKPYHFQRNDIMALSPPLDKH